MVQPSFTTFQTDLSEPTWITIFPTCLPDRRCSRASSALSKGETLSTMSSKRSLVAEIAAQRSSMSYFEPALIPLSLRTLRFEKHDVAALLP